jgi:hypothetical protein
MPSLSRECQVCPNLALPSLKLGTAKFESTDRQHTKIPIINTVERMRSIPGMKVNNAIDNANPHSHRILSGLTCDKWGGPSPEAANCAGFFFFDFFVFRHTIAFYILLHTTYENKSCFFVCVLSCFMFFIHTRISLAFVCVLSARRS